jgi:hypothetical protein
MVRHGLRVLVVSVLLGQSIPSSAQMQNTPVKPMSFEEAFQRHEFLLNEYRENIAHIEDLTSRNQQILSEVNYLSGYLDALVHVARTLDQTRTRSLVTTATLLLRLPPPNWSGPRGIVPTAKVESRVGVTTPSLRGSRSPLGQSLPAVRTTKQEAPGKKEKNRNQPQQTGENDSRSEKSP